VHRVNGDLAVSRGFGDAEYKKTGGPRPEDRPVTADPEMGHFECNATDFVMVVCDGVSEGSLSNADACKLAARVMKETGGDAAKASEAVCHRAVETESKDNISCMIILLGGADAAGDSSANAIAMGKQRESRNTFSTGSPRTITLGKQRDYQPGSLMGSNNSSFVKAYVAMCERGGVSFAESVERRYALLQARKANPEEDDEAELALIGTPQGPEGSPARKTWFETWARDCQERKGGRGDEEEEGGDSEQAMMMKMLLMMMRNQGGQGGGP